MSKQTKVRPSALWMTGGGIQQLPPAAVNTVEASGKPSTQSASLGRTQNSTNNLPPKLSSLTEKEKENALLAAGILASTVPTLVQAGLIRKARHKETREIVLVFPSTLWTDDLKVK